MLNKNNNILILADNRKTDESLESEHGLCALVDTGNKKILFDTGVSGMLLRNAQQLGTDLKEVDFVCISHGHNDHTGGLVHFLEINSKAKVLISRHALTQKFYSVKNGLRNLGTDFEWGKYKERFLLIDKKECIDDLFIFSCNTNTFPSPKANETLYKATEKGLILDNFDHELVFCIGKSNPLIYTGCAHKGLLNILQSTEKYMGRKPSIVLGGFHLPDRSRGWVFETEKELSDIGIALRKNYPDTYFLTGHCTGNHSFCVLKEQLNQHIKLFYTGFTAQL